MMSRRKITFKGKKVIADEMLERNWEFVRYHRTKWLNSTDKYMLMNDRFNSEEMSSILEYRKLLRDLPENYETANDACDNWPSLPDIIKNNK